MLTAMAFLMGFLRLRGAVPGAQFLTYDPKDVGILLGGFMFGPVAALLMSIVLALLEMVTVSESGPIGALMNALSSASLTCTAAIVYSRMRNFKGAIIGLVLGTVVVTTTMILWNYIMVPIYMPFITREAVVALIIPALLPFNLIKAGINSVLALLVYKHVSAALKAARLYSFELGTDAAPLRRRDIFILVLLAATVVAALVAVVLMLLGVI